MRNQLELGYCTSEVDTALEIDKLKKVSVVLDKEPIFSDVVLRLAEWISNYYMCPLGQVLENFAPKGYGDKDKIKISIPKEQGKPLKKIILQPVSQKKVTPSFNHKELYNYLKANQGVSTVKDISQKTGLPDVPTLLLELEEKGKIELEYGVLSKKRRTEYLVTINESAFLSLFGDEDTVQKVQSKSPKQYEALLLLEHYRVNGINKIPQQTLKNENVWDFRIFKALEEKDFIELEKTLESSHIDHFYGLQKNESILELTEDQSAALATIKSHISTDNKPILLHGDTGSGKTLLYIKLIKDAIDSGKQALLMLPEISLTPQMYARFKASFGDSIALVHSRMTERERYLSWKKIQTGEAKLVIGPRSALFSPFVSLGIIIVDEEHDSSYKQEMPAPRYHARDTALYYASLLEIPIILGSATPLMETRYNADSGKYHYVRLQGRAHGVILPEFEMVDMNESKKKGLAAPNLSRELADEMLNMLRQGYGVILYQNKRGYRSVLECSNCGNVNTCPNCSISLTYHKSPSMLRCHLCGYSSILQKVECTECGNQNLSHLGFGTQLVKEDIESWLLEEGLASKQVERMDSDSTAAKGSHEKILADFARGHIDVLIGTQMIAKGIDISRVGLVGVISADTQLYIPDLRGSEKLFQLLVQVGGRAGRSSLIKGKVIVQTYNPREKAIQLAIKNDYQRFFEEEIVHRERAGHPPFRRISKIEISNKDRVAAGKDAMNLSKYLHNTRGLVQFVGPFMPSIEKVNGRFRRFISVRSNKELDRTGKRLQSVIKSGLKEFEDKHRFTSRINVDIDSWSSL
ncbi:MAG: primosomal protein N' [Candidatus Kapaibacteriales bacterium]